MPTAEEIQGLVEARITELAGEASLCWEPPPAGTFDAERAATAALAAAADVGRTVVGAFPPGTALSEVDLQLWKDRAKSAEASAGHRGEQIGGLAKVLLEEFGGPQKSESACDMAVRLLREQRARLEAFVDRAVNPPVAVLPPEAWETELGRQASELRARVVELEGELEEARP